MGTCSEKPKQNAGRKEDDVKLSIRSTKHGGSEIVATEISKPNNRYKQQEMEMDELFFKLNPQGKEELTF